MLSERPWTIFVSVNGLNSVIFCTYVIRIVEIVLLELKIVGINIVSCNVVVIRFIFLF